MIIVQVCSLIFLALLKEADMITPEEAYKLIKKKYPDKEIIRMYDEEELGIYTTCLLTKQDIESYIKGGPVLAIDDTYIDKNTGEIGEFDTYKWAKEHPGKIGEYDPECNHVFVKRK